MPNGFKENECGFTLVELIVVIVILGILAAVAVPKFVAMRSDAERSAVEGFVGALRSARELAMVKFIVCGYPGYTGASNMSFDSFVQFDNNEPADPAPCGVSAGYGNFIGLNGMRDTIFADPHQWAGTSSAIVFTSKTGRTITIQHFSGNITWSASPAY